MCSLQMKQDKQKTVANDSMLFNVSQQIDLLHQQTQEVFEMIKHKMPGVLHKDVQEELWKKIGLKKRQEMDKIQCATVETNVIEIPNLKNSTPFIGESLAAIRECDISKSTKMEAALQLTGYIL